MKVEWKLELPKSPSPQKQKGNVIKLRIYIYNGILVIGEDFSSLSDDVSM